MNRTTTPNLGKRIRQLRERFGLSIPKFAAKVGFDRSYVFRLEKDETAKPSFGFIEAVVKEFGVDREWLASGIGEGGPLKVAVVPYRSGINGYIRMRLEALETIIDTLSDTELRAALDRLVSLAQKDKELGKIFDQVANVVSAMIIRRMSKLPLAESFGEKEK